MTSTSLTLVPPRIEDRDSFLAGLAEMTTASERAAWVYLGDSADPGIPARDFPAYVKTLLARETAPPPGFVTDTVYWAKIGDEVVGRISLRYELNDFLKHVGGHIGYIVRPGRRGQGVASEMLRQILQTPRARSLGKVLLTCDEDNEASARTILKNGGVLENIVPRDDGKPGKKRFWITTLENSRLAGSCLCGSVHWTFEGPIESATACNCTACRRYGALWAYGYVNREITVTGPTRTYQRGGKVLDFHFCPQCGCVVSWLIAKPNEKGEWRIAVNLRLTDDPASIQHLLIDHFDGFGAFEDLPRDGRCIKDLWF